MFKHTKTLEDGNVLGVFGRRVGSIDINSSVLTNQAIKSNNRSPPSSRQPSKTVAKDSYLSHTENKASAMHGPL